MSANSSEKSSFSQKCSRLSQYLKENGSFGDLSLGMTCNGASEVQRLTTNTTMNLFPINEKPGDDGVQRNIESMNLFPQQAGFACNNKSQSSVDASLNKPVSAPEQPQAGQMTIFYGGQVIVFNDFPADKAKEIMLLAGNGSSSTTHTSAYPSGPTEQNTSNMNMTSFAEQAQPSQKPVASDLPIARRNSLHRFLEKRKDRIVTRAPYQASSSSSAAPNKPAESKFWLGLAAQ